MTAIASTTPSLNRYTDSLLANYKWASGNLTYSFPDTGALYGTPYGSDEPLNNFGALNVTQQNAARLAFASIAASADVTFTDLTLQDPAGATIRMAMSDAPSTAWAYLPSTAAEGGDVWFNNSSGYYDNPVLGNYAYATFMHEFGHALGLLHPHDNGMPLDGDSMEYTIMSYRSYVGASLTTGYTNESWGFAQSLMMYDIAAVQHLYGANFSTNSGDTTYSWSPTTGQMFINGVGQAIPGGNRIFQTIWDGGGVDTYDFSNYATNLLIDLRPGQWTTTSTTQLARLHYDGSQIAEGNIANALQYNGDVRSLIENAIGGTGNDIIIGNAANNVLRGGAGNDLLIGGLHDRPLGISWNVSPTGFMGAEWTVAGAGDTDGNGFSDIIWTSSGRIAVWGMAEGQLQTFGVSSGRMGAEWTPIDIADFGGAGRADVLWQTGGQLAVWEMSGSTLVRFTVGTGSMGAEWRVCGTGYFNADQYADVAWANNSGQIGVWTMQGGNLLGYEIASGRMGTEWTAIGVADLTGNGRGDVLWLRDTGELAYWQMDGGRFISMHSLGAIGSEWTFVDSADLNADSTDDLIWRDQSGRFMLWEISGGTLMKTTILTPTLSGSFAGVGTFTSDGVDDLMWYDTGGIEIANLGLGFGDVLEGGPGIDIFRFEALLEAGKIITDFEPGIDKIDLDRLLADGGYNGSNALQDGILRIVQHGSDADVRMDMSGAGTWDTIARLLDTNASSINASDFIF